MRSSRGRSLARTISCGVLEIDGVFYRTLMPSRAETARNAKTRAEKMNKVPLMRLRR